MVAAIVTWPCFFSDDKYILLLVLDTNLGQLIHSLITTVSSNVLDTYGFILCAVMVIFQLN
jgi:hypothetical protein